MCEKGIKFVDKFTDIALAIVCALLMLLGAYAIYDNQYAFSNANDKSLLVYKPGNGELMSNTGDLVKDVIGWITIDDTTIDYPLLQGKNNQEYLNTDPYGEFSLGGSIFLDCRNSADLSDKYSMIYGHHMDNGIMFGELDQYLKRDFFDTHKKGTLTTKKAKYAMNFFSVMKTKSTDGIVFMDAENYERNISKHIKDKAMYYTNPIDGNIVCLSTCADNGSMERLAIFATINLISERGSS